ncbi:MAG: hypothetical protein ACREMY_02675, partial [bacterium]
LPPVSPRAVPGCTSNFGREKEISWQFWHKKQAPGGKNSGYVTKNTETVAVPADSRPLGQGERQD